MAKGGSTVDDQTDVPADAVMGGSDRRSADRPRWPWSVLAAGMVASLAVGVGALAGPATTTVALSSEATPTTGTPATAARTAGTTTSVAPTPTTRARPAATTTTALPTPTTAVLKGNDRAFCELAEKYLDQVQNLSLSLSDRAKARKLLDGLPATDQLVDSAPAEARADMAVITEVLSRLATTLAGVDYDLPQLPPDVLMSLHGPAVTKAMARLDAWTQRSC